MDTKFKVGDKVNIISGAYRLFTGEVKRVFTLKAWNGGVTQQTPKYEIYMPAIGTQTFLERELELVQKNKEQEMEYSLPSGAVIKGTKEQVKATLVAMGINPGDDGIHYNSDHLGLVRIDKMSYNHVANAVRKLIRNYAKELENIQSHEELVSTLKRGVTPNKTYKALCDRLASGK